MRGLAVVGLGMVLSVNNVYSQEASSVTESKSVILASSSVFRWPDYQSWPMVEQFNSVVNIRISGLPQWSIEASSTTGLCKTRVRRNPLSGSEEVREVSYFNQLVIRKYLNSALGLVAAQALRKGKWTDVRILSDGTVPYWVYAANEERALRDHIVDEVLLSIDPVGDGPPIEIRILSRR